MSLSLEEEWAKVELHVSKAYHNISSGNVERNKPKYLKGRERLLWLINEYEFVYPENKERICNIDLFLGIKFIGGGNENFQSRWKVITITTPPGSTRNLEEFKNKIIKFFDNKQWEQLVFTIEHISTNMHAHIAAKFTATSGKKANRLYSSLTAKKYFQDGYTVQKYTEYKGKSQLHLNSKNNIQAKGFIDYILKEFDSNGKPEWKDKKIYYHQGYWERVLSFNEDTKYPTEKFEIKF